VLRPPTQRMRLVGHTAQLRQRTLVSASAAMVLVAAMAGVCSAQTGPSAHHATAPPDSSWSVLDPSSFVRLTLDTRHRPLYARGMRVSKPFVPLHGVLKIDFDRQWMRDHWDEGTHASISITGSILGADGATRAVEIPEYSVIGQQQKTASLDVAAAVTVVQLIQQGGRFAHRVQDFAAQARIASLKSQRSAVDRQLAATDAALRRTLDALAHVYALAASNNLIPSDVEAAAAEIQAAEHDLAGLGTALQAARDSEAPAFFLLMESQVTSINQWLLDLTATQNAPLLEVIGRIVGRSPDVLSANAKDFVEAIKQVQAGGLTTDAQTALEGRLKVVAGEIIDLERGLFQYYRQLPDSTLSKLRQRPQVGSEWPDAVDPSHLLYFADALERAVDSALAHHPCTRDTAGSTGPDSLDMQTADALRAFIQVVGQQSGPRNLGPAGARLREDVRERLAAREQLKKQRLDIAAAYCVDSTRASLTESIWAARDDAYAANNEAVVLFLRSQILDRLIDRVEPTYINLSTLGLQAGDHLVIDVGTSPPRDSVAGTFGHRPWEFEAVKTGWSGILPTVTDGQFFARATGGAEHNFSLRSGVTTLWNYYGRTTFMRTLAPGFGFAALFLQFGNQSSTSQDSIHVSGSALQFGIGPAISVFNNALQFTFGWNLQRAAVMTDATGKTVATSRTYFAIGVSVKEIVQKITGK
jgi:hypothetical protein